MRILHLIHATTFGGVEAAAEHLRRALGSGRPDAAAQGTVEQGAAAQGTVEHGNAAHEDISYTVAALAGAPAGQQAVEADIAGEGVNSPRAALRLLREVRRTRPDVLVTSLWRVVALGPLARRLSPGTRWVAWVHLSQYTNAADRAVHQWALPRADLILCDSDASYEAIVRPALARAGAAVPLRIVRPESTPLVADGPGRTAPASDEPLRLVFWGRMARQKRLDLVIELADEIGRRREAGVELLIAGPDDGEREALEARAAAGPGTEITFSGPLDRDGVAAAASWAHMYVQLSDFEGFAMAAHEALAAGMVCVLTPVGDLAVDVTDGVDAILHAGDVPATADRAIALAADPAAFDSLGRAARSTATSTFADDFAAACRDAVRGTGGGEA